MSRPARELAAIALTGAAICALVFLTAWFLAWAFTIAVRIASSA
jgi:hypothetical protein